QQRKERVGLVLRRRPHPADAAQRNLLGEGETRDLDLAVEPRAVRVAVMAIVLSRPPRRAEAHQQVALNQAEQMIVTLVAEYLAVSAVVAEVSELSVGDGEKDRVEHVQPVIARERQQ